MCFPSMTEYSWTDCPARVTDDGHTLWFEGIKPAWLLEVQGNNERGIKYTPISAHCFYLSTHKMIEPVGKVKSPASNTQALDSSSIQGYVGCRLASWQITNYLRCYH